MRDLARYLRWLAKCEPELKLKVHKDVGPFGHPYQKDHPKYAGWYAALPYEVLIWSEASQSWKSYSANDLPTDQCHAIAASMRYVLAT